MRFSAEPFLFDGGGVVKMNRLAKSLPYSFIHSYIFDSVGVGIYSGSCL